MNIVWFSWKDTKHPLAGGAEIITDVILRNLVLDGHQVTLLTARYSGSINKDKVNGYNIIRTGNRFTVYIRTCLWYFKNLRKTTDLLIDEMNTLPFFAKFFSRKSTKSVLFTHQLCRQVWFYQISLPIAVLGYLIEPIYLFILSKVYNDVITISNSTKDDLIRYGFKSSRIYIISESINTKPINSVIDKFDNKPKRILLMGALRPMKRTLDCVKAFKLINDQYPDTFLDIAGPYEGKYGNKVIDFCNKNLPDKSYKIHGRVSDEQRDELMKEAFLLLACSIKEGWGLIVSEAASRSTPSVVYDVDGLRDSTFNGYSGIISEEKPFSLAREVMKIIDNKNLYIKLQSRSLKKSKSLTEKNCYKNFKLNIERLF